jgi:hypothetical protein
MILLGLVVGDDRFTAITPLETAPPAGVTSDVSRTPSIFAWSYERLGRLMAREVGEHRDELRRDLSGRVVEMGAPSRLQRGGHDVPVPLGCPNSRELA